MGWLPPGTIERLTREAAALTPDERDSLTWEESRRFVAMDTLELATWNGLKASGKYTPWEAVARLRGFQE
jgi:hypothetical protein